MGLVVSILYLRTLAPGVLRYTEATQDSPALQVAVPTLGISHPTGYPTYMMLAHLFTYLPVGEMAYRVNLASAAFGVAAVILVYLVGLKLCGRALAAAVGAWSLGVSQTFWSQAVIAEVYTLHVALMTLVLYVLLLWRERRKDGYLLLAAFCGGLAMTNHLTSGLLIPAGLAFVFLVDRHQLSRIRLLLAGAGLFLIGLLPYIYLPLRASAQLPEFTMDPSTFGGFWEMVSGGPFKGAMFVFGPVELGGRFIMYLGYLSEQFPLVLLLAGGAGLLYMLARDQAGSALLGIVFLGSLVYSLEYDIADIYVYFLPTYLAVSLWMCVGVSAGASAIGQKMRVVMERLYPVAGKVQSAPPTLALLALALAVALLGAAENYGEADRSRDERGREMIKAVIREVEPGATVVHRRSPLMYMSRIEDRGRGIRLWDFAVSHTDEELARASEDLAQGRVYFLSPEPETVERFEDAGYRLAEVEEGILYRAVPGP